MQKEAFFLVFVCFLSFVEAFQWVAKEIEMQLTNIHWLLNNKMAANELRNAAYKLAWDCCTRKKFLTATRLSRIIAAPVSTLCILVNLQHL